MKEILATFEDVATNSLGYARRWKEAAPGRQVIGLFPMHLSGELAHAAGALPVVLQEDQEPITIGHSAVFNFYCGYNRSITDQALRGEFDFLDVFMFADHCVQLLGTADIIRDHMPNKPIIYHELIGTVSASWAEEEVRQTFRFLWRELARVLGREISEDAVRNSIRAFNKNRGLIRRLYELRRAGKIALTASQMQHIVKSSMVMDKAEHTALLEKLMEQLSAAAPRNDAVRVYLSGHLCQAPKLEILDIIEECGAVVVDDDLYHGQRYVSTDMAEEGHPADAMADWYFARNKKLPCPTRADHTMDWDKVLLANVDKSKASGLIVLQAKFCEPHMYVYPEIKETFEEAGIPHLLVETEHESMPMEALKTRLETFLEIVKRRADAA